MPSFNAFNKQFGTEQGRCAPDNFSSDGTYAFTMGHDEPLTFARLRVVDRISISQTADIGTTKVLKARVRCRGPEFMPGDTNWRLSLYIDGVEKTHRICTAETLTDFVSFAANLTGYAGSVSIAFVLKLMES